MDADTIPENPRGLDESSESSCAELNDDEGEDESEGYSPPRGGYPLAPEMASSFAFVENQMGAIQVEDPIEIGSEWEEKTINIKDIVSQLRSERRAGAKIYRSPRLRRKDRTTKRPWSARETHAGLDIEEPENEVARSDDKKVKKRKRHHSKRKETEEGGKRRRHEIRRSTEDIQNHPTSLPCEHNTLGQEGETPCTLSANILRDFGIS